jgi:hypothetical protein
MTRKEKIIFLIKAIEEIEGVSLAPGYFEKYSDEQIDDEVEWLDYLLTK